MGIPRLWPFLGALLAVLTRTFICARVVAVDLLTFWVPALRLGRSGAALHVVLLLSQILELEPRELHVSRRRRRPRHPPAPATAPPPGARF